MSSKNTPVNSNEENYQFPYNLRGFSKDPIKELLFLVLIAISYLYIDIKVTNEEIQEKQNKKIELLEDKVEELTQQLRKSESELAAASSKIRVLQDLGKIR